MPRLTPNVKHVLMWETIVSVRSFNLFYEGARSHPLNWCHGIAVFEERYLRRIKPWNLSSRKGFSQKQRKGSLRFVTWYDQIVHFGHYRCPTSHTSDYWSWSFIHIQSADCFRYRNFPWVCGLTRTRLSCAILSLEAWWLVSLRTTQRRLFSSLFISRRNK